MKLSITIAARQDIERATAFYASQQYRLGQYFLDEIDRVLTVLRHNPWLGQSMDDLYRRIHLRKFPYTLIYKFDDPYESIHISAVCHQYRRPDYWRDRVEEPGIAYSSESLAA